MTSMHPTPSKDRFLNLQGESMSTENLGQLLKKTRSITSQRNLDGGGNELLTNHYELDALLSSVFAINRDLKNVVQGRQDQSGGIQACFKKLRKDIYYLIRNFDAGSLKMAKSEKGYDFMTEEKSNPNINRSDLNAKMEHIKRGINSIERGKELKFLENMVNSLKSLENLVSDREAILRKFLELGGMIDGAGEEVTSRMEKLRMDLKAVAVADNKLVSRSFRKLKSSSLNTLTVLEIKENYSVLKEVDINRFNTGHRSSLGPVGISKYKKLMDSYANMNNPRKDPRKLEKKTSKKKIPSHKNLTNLRILSNMEMKKQSKMATKQDFSFQVKESNLMISKDSELVCSLAPEQESQKALEDCLRKLESELQQKSLKAAKYKRATKEYKVRLQDLETMNSNFGKKVSILEEEKGDLKNEIANIREVMEDLKNECYRLEKEIEQKDERMAISCQPKLGTVGLKALKVTQMVDDQSFLEKQTLISDTDSQMKEVKGSLAERILSMVSLTHEGPSPSKFNQGMSSHEMASLENMEKQGGVITQQSSNNTGFDEYENKSFEEMEQTVSKMVLLQAEKNVFLNSRTGECSGNESVSVSVSESLCKSDVDPRQTVKWLNQFVKTQIKKISLRKQLEHKKDLSLKQSKMSSPKALFKANKNTITFRALKESLSPTEINKLGLSGTETRRCSIDFKNMNLEQLKKHLNQSGGTSNFITINTSNFRNQEQFLETTKEAIFKNYQTLEDLLIIPVKSLQNLDSFNFIGKTRDMEKKSDPEEVSREAEKQQAENNDLKRKIEELEEELEQILTENEFYKMNWPTQNEMDKLQNDAEGKQTNKNESDLDHNQDYDQLRREVVSLQEEVYKAELEKKTLIERAESIKEDKRLAQESLQITQNELDFLTEINQELEYEVSENKQNIVELEELMMQFESEKEERHRQRRDLQVKSLESYGHWNTRRNEELRQVKDDLGDLEKQNITLIEELTKLEENQEEMKRALEERQKEDFDKEQLIQSLETDKLLLEEGLERAKIEHQLAERDHQTALKEQMDLQRENDELLREKKESKGQLEQMSQGSSEIRQQMQKMVSRKFEMISTQVGRLDSLNRRVISSLKRISKVKSLFKSKQGEFNRLQISNHELKQSLQKVEELRDTELAQRNKMILVDSEEDMLSQMSRLSNSRLSKSRRSSDSGPEAQPLEEENKRLISQIVGLEDQLKNLKDKYNALIFEKNEWEDEKKFLEKIKNKAERQQQEKEYLKVVKNSNHISLKKENLELKRKLDRAVKLLQKKTNDSESQIWGAFSSMRGSSVPYQISSINPSSMGMKESFARSRPVEENVLGNLNMTMVSNKNSNDSFLNKSGRSDIAININGINTMIGEGNVERNADPNESFVVKQKKVNSVSGHRRTASDQRELVNGSMILRNFAFKKDEGKVSQFAMVQQHASQFGGNFESSQMAQRDSKLWFYLSFCDIFKLNLSDFDQATVKEFLEQLFHYKKFHDQLTKQVQKEFNLLMQDRDLRKFILKKLKRFQPIDLFVRKNVNTKKVQNTTSTERFENPRQPPKSGEESQIGDFSMTMDGSTEASKMQELIEIVNSFGQTNEQLEIKLQALTLSYKKLESQLEVSDKDKCQLLEDIQMQKNENKQTIESSVFLTEKNIKNFVRKCLTRLLKIWHQGSFGDEFEMCFESLTQSLEYGFREKEELLRLLSD